jgi:hypothetical protein
MVSGRVLLERVGLLRTATRLDPPHRVDVQKYVLSLHPAQRLSVRGVVSSCSVQGRKPMPCVKRQQLENCAPPTKHPEAQRIWQRSPLKYVGQTHVNDSTPSLHVPKLRQGLELHSLMLLAQ